MNLKRPKERDKPREKRWHENPRYGRDGGAVTSIPHGVPELNQTRVTWFGQSGSCPYQRFIAPRNGSSYPSCCFVGWRVVSAQSQDQAMSRSRLSVSPRPTGLIDDFSLINLFLVPAEREGFATTFICGLGGALKLNFTNPCAAIAPDTFGYLDQVQDILLSKPTVSEGEKDTPAGIGE